MRWILSGAGLAMARMIVACAASIGLSGCLFSDVPPAPTQAFGMAFNVRPADGSEPPSSPAFFVRAASSTTWSDEPIVVPKALDRVDYEGELVIVIGRRARRVTPEEAESCILGYTCGMDGTPFVAGPGGEKDLLRSIAGKSVDGIAPVGPAVVPSLGDAPRRIVLRINGEEQRVAAASTADLVWSPSRVVSEISRTVTLEPGDLIFAGARAAVPQLRHGDEVEVEIDGIGLLRRRVVEEGR